MIKKKEGVFIMEHVGECEILGKGLERVVTAGVALVRDSERIGRLYET